MFNALSVSRRSVRLHSRVPPAQPGGVPAGARRAMPARMPGRAAAGLLLALLGCLPLAWPGQARARDLVVIVSARSPVTALHAQDVASIFLAETSRLPGGGEVAALDQKLGSPARNEFYARVAARSPEQMKAHWSKMMFTGRGQPPRELAGNAAVRRQVAADPALIGYIDSAALNASVRAVLVLK